MGDIGGRRVLKGIVSHSSFVFPEPQPLLLLPLNIVLKACPFSASLLAAWHQQDG